jgi:hypothetical protein
MFGAWCFYWLMGLLRRFLRWMYCDPEWSSPSLSRMPESYRTRKPSEGSDCLPRRHTVYSPEYARRTGIGDNAREVTEVVPRLPLPPKLVGRMPPLPRRGGRLGDVPD